jgi:uncharacterized iron-regulated membrane protein
MRKRRGEELISLPPKERRVFVMEHTRKSGFFLLLLFVIFLVIGINSGEAAAVWEKAVNICLSCIGIG